MQRTSTFFLMKSSLSFGLWRFLFFPATSDSWTCIIHEWITDRRTLSWKLEHGNAVQHLRKHTWHSKTSKSDLDKYCNDLVLYSNEEISPGKWEIAAEKYTRLNIARDEFYAIWPLRLGFGFCSLRFHPNQCIDVFVNSEENNIFSSLVNYYDWFLLFLYQISFISWRILLNLCFSSHIWTTILIEL